jgi:hypothetical protein
MSTELNEIATGSDAPEVKPPDANTESERDGGIASTDEQVTADESTDAEEGKPSDPQKTIDKLLRRIQRQSGKIGATARERELISQENTTLKAQLAELRGESPQTQEPNIEDVAERKAREILHAESLNKRAAEVLSAGKKVTGFSEALEALREDIPFIGRDKRPTPFFEALLETDEPAKLIHHLGTNPDLAAEFEGLSQSQIGRRLAKLEGQLLQDGKVKSSKAPAPIDPIKGTGGQVSQDLAKMSFSDYEKARAKQGAGWSRFRS